MAYSETAAPFAFQCNAPIAGAIRGVTLVKGETKTVSGGAAVVWSKDPLVRILVRLGRLSLVVYGMALPLPEAEQWLASIARGDIQF